MKKNYFLAFVGITLFYFFESAQMSYFNILAPYYLKTHLYSADQIANLSAAYYYGNVVGLIPVGWALDKFPLRTVVLWAIFGSILGAFLLLFSPDISLQWVARFLCGFFGGAFSFVGGIKVIASIYANRFSLFMGIFIATGMLGGLICQYPLLMVVNHIGPDGAMMIVALFGLLVGAINVAGLHLPKPTAHTATKYSGTFGEMCSEIVRNLRNWLDCLMIVLLDTPVSIVGTLWGIVLFSGFYGFSQTTCAWIVTSLFFGLMIGCPLWGLIAEKTERSTQIIALGSGVSAVCIILMLFASSAVIVGFLAFLLGFFSACQTLGFTWITQNMKPELIGRNSAFNSMIFMGTNGIVKQIGAVLLSASPWIGASSTSNLLLFLIIAMSITLLYVLTRRRLFRVI